MARETRGLAKAPGISGLDLLFHGLTTDQDSRGRYPLFDQAEAQRLTYSPSSPAYADNENHPPFPRLTTKT